MAPDAVEGHGVDWQQSQAGIRELRDIVQDNSRAASRAVDLVEGARVRVTVVQGLLLTRPQGPREYNADPSDPAMERPPEPRPIDAAQEPDRHRVGGLARLREGPLADLFRATGPRAS